jgi:hypothetical protein
VNDSLGTALLIVLGVLAIIAVIVVGGGLYVVVKYRLPLRGIVAVLGSVVYLVSPVDAVPEVPLGPIGLVDDAAVLVAAGLYLARLVASRRAQLDPASDVSSARSTKPPTSLGGRRRDG